MDEANDVLFEKMCCRFPGLPRDIIRFYVSQNSNDELACIQVLHEFQNSFGQRGFLPSKQPKTNTDLAVSQFNNLNIKDCNSKANEALTSAAKNSTKNGSNRSISNAGISNNPDISTAISRPQTAPVSSGNFQGFNYALYIPYGAPQFYTNSGNNNNNILYQPVLSGIDNRLLLQLPPEKFLRPNSPQSEDVYMRPNSPHSQSVNASSFSSNTSDSPVAKGHISPHSTAKWLSSSHPSGIPLPPRPSPHSYILSPPVNPSSDPVSQDQHFTPTSGPSRKTSNLEDSPRNNIKSPVMNRSCSDMTNLGTQLHVDVEPNDNPVHEWIPLNAYNPSPNYSRISPLPFPVLPTPENVSSSHSTSNVYPKELGVSDQLPAGVQPSPIWSQGSVPIIPTSGIPYAHPVYFPVTSSGAMLLTNSEVQKHVYLQRQKLNSLRYELEKTKTEYVKLKEESLEQELKDRSCAKNKDEILHLKEEITSLNMECFCLCMEVDQYLKGKALLGEINEDFYSCINTGQQGPLLPVSHRPEKTKKKKKTEPIVQRKFSSDEDEENKESSKWKCVKCTFANHPAISVCEMCTEPRSITVRDDCGNSDC